MYYKVITSPSYFHNTSIQHNGATSRNRFSGLSNSRCLYGRHRESQCIPTIDFAPIICAMWVACSGLQCCFIHGSYEPIGIIARSTHHTGAYDFMTSVYAVSHQKNIFLPFFSNKYALKLAHVGCHFERSDVRGYLAPQWFTSHAVIETHATSVVYVRSNWCVFFCTCDDSHLCTHGATINSVFHPLCLEIALQEYGWRWSMCECDNSTISIAGSCLIVIWGLRVLTAHIFHGDNNNGIPNAFANTGSVIIHVP